MKKLKQLTALLATAGLLLLPASGIEAANQPAPVNLTTSTFSAPLSLAPLLTWQADLEAVCYELEIFTHLPDKLKTDQPDKRAVFRTSKIFTNAYNPLLSKLLPDTKKVKPLWWRVRALDLQCKPISQFSQLSCIFVSPDEAPMNAPVALDNLGKTPNTTLLYPAYNWYKQNGAESFEVQLFDTNPEEEEDAQPIDVLTTSYGEVYDHKPRFGDTPFYWRVRSLDKDGAYLGNWSQTVSFTTSPEECATRIAAYGDSISHGGGHVSYGPEDPAYSWLYYLNFPCLNLSQSGDITADLVSRFASDVLPFKPEYLLIMIGTNDLRSYEHNVAEAINNIEALRTICAQADIKPIFLTLPPINPKNIEYAFQEKTDKNWVQKFNAFNRYLCTLPHIDTAAAFAPYIDTKGNLPTSLGLDGLHEDISGKKLIAEAINKNLPAALEAADRLADN